MCDVSGLSASSSVEKTPPESAEPRDSAEASSRSQESLPDRDSPAPDAAPQPDPDAWIQVEKRHRQPPGKAKVLEKLAETSRSAYIFIFHPFYCVFYSALSCPPLSVTSCRFLLFVSLCLCPPPVGQQHVSDDVCVFSSSPPPSALQPDRLPSAVEYFLLSARSSPHFLCLSCASVSHL